MDADINGGRLVALIAGALIVAAALTTGAIAQEGTVNWEDLPAAVQKAIEAHLPGAVGMAVDREIENGVAVYGAETEEDEMEKEIEVTESGNLIELEEEIDLADLPDEVRSAIESLYPGGDILEADKMMEVTYEIEVRVGERVVEVEVDPLGELEMDTGDEEEEHEYEEGHEDDDD